MSNPVPYASSSSLEITTLSSFICLWEGGLNFHVHNMTVYMIFQFGALSINTPLDGVEAAYSTCLPQMSTLLNLLMSSSVHFSPVLLF